MKRSVPSLGSFAAAVLIGLGVQIDVAAAQAYPSQPIKIIVATPPGGIADLVGRTFAQKLSEGGKTALVENRTGAGGALAAEATAKASTRRLHAVRQHAPDQCHPAASGQQAFL